LTDAAYYRSWRAAHPEYRARQNRLRHERRRRNGRGDRRREYAKRASRAAPQLTPLFPDIKRGASVAFWDEELQADLRQEAVLAALEGRDPAEAVRAYAVREWSWHRSTNAYLDRG